ncbi:MAG: hypothetical protein ACFFAK_10665 [Promethearchaeota archaeon]
MPGLHEFDEYVLYSWRNEQIKEQIKKNKHVKRIRNKIKKTNKKLEIGYS